MASAAILVTSSSLDSQGSYSAYQYVRALLESEHDLQGVFFYHAGVDVANSLQIHLSDELDMHAKWSALASQYGFSLMVCVTAANRRGVISHADAVQDKQHERYNLEPPFSSVGLGDLAVMVSQADRLVQF